MQAEMIMERLSEPQCMAALLPEATQPAPVAAAIRATATTLVQALRAKGSRGGVDSLIREYDLSSQEGVALMCLAEALLRIPDAATRDRLIRDKIGGGDWRAHLGHSPSLFVNAATWGLLVTGRLSATSSESGLSAALVRLIGRGGEPLIRKGVDMAIRLMGEQFVTGQTIAEALANSRTMEARGFRYSFDMLGEAATTAEDAARYLASYTDAIGAIGRASGGRGIQDGPGISVKLSALHPRYARAQRDRVMAELLPRLTGLAVLARRHDIGLNIDAEEADRLELSLDLLTALCADPALAGWNGVGFVVQAYQKRAPAVIDRLIDLARHSRRRMMVRLVKGAYWDSEIKRAQVDGLADFPVYTRKLHTDVSYLACARRMLAAPDAVFPQFATHNAQTVASILAMAGPEFHAGQYEFQCLHGMGEALYEEVVGPGKLNRPCRIYAPVGTHETLLAYLVRRLLENGANTSFVNRIADAAVPVADLVADPAALVAAAHPVGAPHPAIALPGALFAPERTNSPGMDLADEAQIARLSDAIASAQQERFRAAPIVAARELAGTAIAVRNPANLRDTVGTVVQADAAVVEQALAAATPWDQAADARAACLERAADDMAGRMPELAALLVREAGKAWPDAVSEVREAIDFLRYYAFRARELDAAAPLGAVACISPWNFPLAIFTGQIAAALAAGNAVLAKPAEETPLIAAQAVRLLHAAGVPATALQLLPGEGDVGAALVADARVDGVLFTGSTAVARLIRATLARRLGRDGKPLPLIAETGGQNAMMVDSSALAEQVVADVLASAFNSAGQRCSALRVLCVQDDVADRTLRMLRGAMTELALGDPARLATDVGPVISTAAREAIEAHVAAMREAGFAVRRVPVPPDCAEGTFVPPTLIEIDRIDRLTAEIFGPVLHVLRWRREGADTVMQAIAATGFGLTFGVHSRIDETIGRLTERSAAGNIYVNRNIVGAVVGVQPFGGHGLSGTGPKAGGPLYLRRLVRRPAPLTSAAPAGALADAWRGWLRTAGHTEAAARCEAYQARSPLGAPRLLAGPVGERNVYATAPRGTVLCVPSTPFGLLAQISAAIVTGNAVMLRAPAALLALVSQMPVALRTEDAACEACLFEGEAEALRTLEAELAARDGPIVQTQSVTPDALQANADDYALEWLITERVLSTNTAAAGGNATLMTIG